MLEIALAVGACVVIGKVASADGRSAIVWGLITAGICFLSLLIPIPFLRVLIAFGVAFGVMIAVKAIRGDR
jgi:hypothetical protein